MSRQLFSVCVGNYIFEIIGLSKNIAIDFANERKLILFMFLYDCEKSFSANIHTYRCKK
jgi:hypothetical protein